MIVACDIDGVVANLMEAWLARYNRDYNDKLTKGMILSWGIDMYVKPECGLKIFQYIEDPAIYDEVWPEPAALRGVMSLREAGHRVVFVTSSTAGASGAKLRWLRRWRFLDESYKSLVDYVEAADKSLVRADVMIDDYFKNLEGFQGKGYLFRQPWNAGVGWPYHIMSWNGVIENGITAE